MPKRRITLYDTTLRDGAQTQGVDFSVADKLAIAAELDHLGIDYIEGGWPGANPTDDAFFANPPALKTARLTAFGMTRRPGRSAANDPGLQAVIGGSAPAVCLVGKSWNVQVQTALGLSLEENLDLIGDSIAQAVLQGREALFDGEHFFDGYKTNPAFAVACLERALAAGAAWVVLCDTNGGTLPCEIGRIVAAVAKIIPGDKIGIHTHNDTENAVAGSLAAVSAGACMVQGTLNGLGERCGNANLVSLLPTLMLKLDYETGVTMEGLQRLTAVSRMLDERLNRAPNRHAAYVGSSAFAHKGGLHVSAMAKDSTSYEHIDPALVGNRRHVIVSDQAGRANLLSRLNEVGIKIAAADPRLPKLLDLVKQREFAGFTYDGAAASFELLARRTLDEVDEFFRVLSFRVIDERRWNAKGELVTLSEATIKVEVDDQVSMTVAEGNGPVNALDSALRKVLLPLYPALEGMRLVDYKVRILTPQDGTKAVTRVMIDSADVVDSSLGNWATVGVSPNIIDASFNALHDSITYRLLQARLRVATLVGV